MARLSSFYRAMALIVLNTIVALLLLQLAVWAASEIRHAVRGVKGTIYSSAFDRASYQVVDAQGVAEIAEEFDAMGEHLSFRFNPWTSFQAGGFEGRRLNVVEDPVLNHRRTPPPSENGKPPLTLWVFGGSTVFGWGVSDDTTFPAALQFELQHLLPERRVAVVNFGQPYWFSSVQVAILGPLLRDRPAPDLTLFLDGLNDTIWGLGGFTVPPLAGVALKAWERQQSDARRELPWLTVNDSLPMLRLVDYLIFKGGIERPDDKARYRNAVADPVAHVSDTHRANRRLAEAVLRAFGSQALFLLQPVPWHGAYRDPPAGQTGVNSGTGVAVYEALLAATREEQKHFRSVADALLTVPKPFVDAAHYSDHGNAVLARAVAPLVIEAVARRAP